MSNWIGFLKALPQVIKGPLLTLVVIIALSAGHEAYSNFGMILLGIGGTFLLGAVVWISWLLIANWTSREQKLADERWRRFQQDAEDEKFRDTCRKIFKTQEEADAYFEEKMRIVRANREFRRKRRHL